MFPGQRSTCHGIGIEDFHSWKIVTYIRALTAWQVAHNARKKGFEFTWKLQEFESLKMLHAQLLL